MILFNIKKSAYYRKSWRRLAKKYHPDMQRGGAKDRHLARFREISEAFDVLKDDEKRRRYDNGEKIK